MKHHFNHAIMMFPNGIRQIIFNIFNHCCLIRVTFHYINCHDKRRENWYSSKKFALFLTFVISLFPKLKWFKKFIRSIPCFGFSCRAGIIDELLPITVISYTFIVSYNSIRNQTRNLLLVCETKNLWRVHPRLKFMFTYHLLLWHRHCKLYCSDSLLLLDYNSN